MKGVRTLRITEKNGPLVCLRTVTGDEDLLIMTNKGVIIRFHAEDVSQTGRGALGVRMMRLDQDAISKFISDCGPRRRNRRSF